MSNSTYKMNFTTKVDAYWEVLLKGKKIGLIYQTTKNGEWAWGWSLEYPEWSLPQFMVSQKKVMPLQEKKHLRILCIAISNLLDREHKMRWYEIFAEFIVTAMLFVTVYLVMVFVFIL